MMKFGKAGKLTIDDLYTIANKAVCSKASCCDFQLEDTRWRLVVGQLALTLENYATCERYDKTYLDQPEESECLQLLVQVLQYE